MVAIYFVWFKPWLSRRLDPSPHHLGILSILACRFPTFLNRRLLTLASTVCASNLYRGAAHFHHHPAADEQGSTLPSSGCDLDGQRLHNACRDASSTIENSRLHPNRSRWLGYFLTLLALHCCNTRMEAFADDELSKDSLRSRPLSFRVYGHIT